MGNLSMSQKSKGALFVILVMIFSLLLAGLLYGQGLTERVSVSSTGIQGDRRSYNPSISADGRYVAFESEAENLVPGDTNGRMDIFVHDRQSGETTRVSVSSTGVEADDRSYYASISSDGRYVAFESDAANLVGGDTNGRMDIFVHDRQTGETTRSSVNSTGVEADERSYNASISSDGRYVAFESDATNLVTGDTNAARDVFVHDRQTGQTIRASVSSTGVQGNGDSLAPSISSDGRYVTFEAVASNLIQGANSTGQILVHDQETGETALVSRDSGGVQGNGTSARPSISPDSRYIAFSSLATNLIAGDANNVEDIFIHDRQTGQTTLASVSSTGAQGNGASQIASISSNGRYVAFQSLATNLVTGDTNVAPDVFVHDRLTGRTKMASVSSNGVQGEGTFPVISLDGRHVSFQSVATNLVPGDTNGADDIFVHALPLTGASSDFDDDGKTDIAVYRAGTGAWYVIPSSTGVAYGLGWGGDATDIPVPGDFDGDAQTDIAVYRAGTGAWYVIPSSTGVAYGMGWGGDPYDIPTPADYDGDGETDIAVYRAGTGAWYVIPSSTGVAYGMGWGGDPSDTPVPGDYDGDGETDIAVYRASTGAWYIIPSSTGVPYGTGWGGDATDIPVPGDYDGDGRTDIAVYRASSGGWYIIPSSTSVPYGVGWGADPTDIPVPGDYDGDGETDIAVYRASTGAWYIIPSATGTPYGTGWGGDPTDIPVTQDLPSILQ
jgi:Tol biopolymer transport system component